MYTHFKIGSVCFSVSCKHKFPWTDEVSVFRTQTLQHSLCELQYELDFIKEFAPIWGNILYQDNSLMVMNSDGIEHRIHMLPNSGEPFAVTRHLDEYHVQIQIDDRALPVLKWDRNLIGLFSLEHYCLSYDAFLLHASFIIYQNEAIIFTAPSGTGKSTQADLWKKYENAQIINGDRTLLIHRNNQWFASGFPVCGSSEYCLNEQAPVKAIICLEQGFENELKLLSPVEALKNLYSQSFVNRWNPDDCHAISSFIDSITQKVPVYKYRCTKYPDAVSKLKERLF